MTLYNKDGSVYKLNGPNPMMKEQDFWKEFSTHNLSWKPEIHEDSGVRVLEPTKKAPSTTQGESFIEELELSKEEFINFESNDLEVEERLELTEGVENPKPVSRPKAPKQNTSSDGIKKTFVYCLPAVVSEKEDSLYGDVSVRVRYDKSTSFEAVILNQSDMKIEMWSEVLFREGSIIYPKNGDKRWWRIQSHYPKVGGYVMQSVPSQDQPYFE